MKILRRLACKFDLDQSERKQSQVNASARMPWPNGVASSPRFSSGVYLRLRLARALSGETSLWLCGCQTLLFFTIFNLQKNPLSLQNIKIGNFLTVVYSSLGDDLGIAVCPRSCHGYVLMPKFSFILKYSGLVFAALFCASEMNHI